jgi:MFS transporter, DHA1 family, inner membrane transport protein
VSSLKLVTLTLIRVVMNTAIRMIYPFLAVFARGLGVEIGTISGLVANRAIIGVATPFIFPFIETRGRKFGMLLGLGLFMLAMGIVALYPSLTTLGIGLILGLVGKTIFDPSMTSYVADHIAYEKRGTAIAITEFSWSSAFILGVPAAAWLIAASTWSSPFWALGLLGLIGFGYLALTLTDSARPVHHVEGIFGNLRAIFCIALRVNRFFNWYVCICSQ